MKGLDNYAKAVVGLKRKRSSQDIACPSSSDSSHVLQLPACCQLSADCGSKTRSDGYVKRTPSILRKFSNFMKSGFPKRLLYYKGGEWRDYPVDIIDLVKQDFQAKKAITELKFEGHQLLFDFVHMFQVDSETGLQQRIGWIDENGNCFFPETLSDVCESHEYGNSDGGEHEIQTSANQSRTQEIKLEMEEPASPAQSSTSEDNGDEISNVKRFRIDDPLNVHADIKEAVGENEIYAAVSHRYPAIDSLHGCLTSLVPGGKVYTVVQDMLLLGLRQFLNPKDIVGIFHVPPTSDLGQTRLKHFQKQVGITQNHRGNANVRYGWLAASSAAVKNIMLEGPGRVELPVYSAMHGVGVYLTPANRSNIRCVFLLHFVCIIFHILFYFLLPDSRFLININFYSASLSDVDENGIVYMVLCRVILGKLECVPPYSKQFQPSSESFDNGIDNLQNPNYYVIWNMHADKHIFPEYVVSFRVPAKIKGDPCYFYLLLSTAHL